MTSWYFSQFILIKGVKDIFFLTKYGGILLEMTELEICMYKLEKMSDQNKSWIPKAKDQK